MPSAIQHVNAGGEASLRETRRQKPNPQILNVHADRQVMSDASEHQLDKHRPARHANARPPSKVRAISARLDGGDEHPHATAPNSPRTVASRSSTESSVPAGRSKRRGRSIMQRAT